MAQSLPPLVRKSASISSCGTYRYRLARIWDQGVIPIAFVMLNPSTADAEVDDPTIRRCMGFARRDGFGGIVVVNLYALRATKPEKLKEVNDPFGSWNERNLQEVATHSKELGVPVVCAWGAGGTVQGGYKVAIDLFQRAGARLVCLGKTKDGHPRHPLCVRSNQPLVDFL